MPFVSIVAGRIVSDKLEYNLVDHCNFACDECSHFSPFLKRHALPLETFVKDLRRLSEVMRVRRFRFVGGEPLLNPAIINFVSAVRDSRICESIEVVSNGVLLDRVPDEFYRKIDSLKISRYPDSRCNEKVLQHARVRCREYGTSFHVDEINSFRRMQVREAITDERLVSDLFESCLIAHTWSCQTFYDGYFYLCSRPIYTRQYLEKLAEIEVDFRSADGVALHEERLFERLLGAMRRSSPLMACRYCLGTAGKRQEWRQLTRAERQLIAPPPARAPSDSIARWRLRFLLGWRKVEKAILSVCPSRPVSRFLALIVTAIVRD